MTDAMDNLKTGVVALVMISLIGAALAISLDSFQDDIGEAACAKNTGVFTTYSATNNVCTNSSGGAQTQAVNTEAFNATVDGLNGTANATDYLDTIGTLLGVAALVAVVVGAFFVFRRT